MNLESQFQFTITEHLSVVQDTMQSRAVHAAVVKAGTLIVQSLENGGRILLCGNGGSAADAQHIATELVVRFFKNRRALDAETLTVNTSSLTAIGNDLSFDHIFSRQVEAKGRANDVLIGFTTSGTSPNIVKALEVAQSMELRTICFTGAKAPASLEKLCDALIKIPSACTPRIQECHIMLGHIICEYVESRLCP